MKYEYLIVMILTVLVPFIKSFSREINFYKPMKRFIAAMTLPFVLFVTIDIIAVKRDLWTFNPDYVVGWYLMGLPIEEISFFAVVPFACIFTWETVKYFQRKMGKRRERVGRDLKF